MNSSHPAISFVSRNVMNTTITMMGWKKIIFNAVIFRINLNESCHNITTSIHSSSAKFIFLQPFPFYYNIDLTWPSTWSYSAISYMFLFREDIINHHINTCLLIKSPSSFIHQNCHMYHSPKAQDKILLLDSEMMSLYYMLSKNVQSAHSFRGQPIHIPVDRKKSQSTILPPPDILSLNHRSLEMHKYTLYLAFM